MTDLLWGEIDAELGGVVRRLRFGIGDIERLEDRLELGLLDIVRSLAQGRYRLRYVREILTLGLEAAGWRGTEDAVRLMIRQTSPGECQSICLRLLSVALGGEATVVPGECDEG